MRIDRPQDPFPPKNEGAGLTWSISRPSSPFRHKSAIARAVEPGANGKEKTMRKLVILASVAALVGATGLARAESLGRPCTTKPEADYLSLDALKTKVVEQGYEIRSGEIKKACGEFYVIDKAGKKAELFVDPTSGIIVAGGDATGKAAEAEKDDD